jgi:hypothetical protein
MMLQQKRGEDGLHQPVFDPLSRNRSRFCAEHRVAARDLRQCGASADGFRCRLLHYHLARSGPSIGPIRSLHEAGRNATLVFAAVIQFAFDRNALGQLETLALKVEALLWRR